MPPSLVLTAVVTVLSLLLAAGMLVYRNSLASQWIFSTAEYMGGRVGGHGDKMFGANPSEPVCRDDPGWLDVHQELCERAHEGKTELIFLGDSITNAMAHERRFVDAFWGKFNPDYFGIPGDETQHLLWRIQNGELDGAKPRVVVLLIGTNNLSHDDGDDVDVVAGVTAVVRNLEKQLPTSKVLVMGIFPRGERANTPVRRRIKNINQMLSRLDDGSRVEFIDISSKLVEDDGSISDRMMPDYLHLSSHGYHIWLTAIRPLLDGMLK